MRTSQYSIRKIGIHFFERNINTSFAHFFNYLHISYFTIFYKGSKKLFKRRCDFLKSKSQKVEFARRKINVQLSSRDKGKIAFCSCFCTFFKACNSIMICNCNSAYILFRGHLYNLRRCILSVGSCSVNM